jgi:hypothetical protein
VAHPFAVLLWNRESGPFYHGLSPPLPVPPFLFALESSGPIVAFFWARADNFFPIPASERG